jgi:hypothetical protein
MNRKLMLLFIILCFGNISGLSQAVQVKSVPNELTLKIIFFKGRPAAYQSVAEATAKPSGSWFALFQKIPNWQPPADALPVRAVNFLTRLEGNAVKVNVSVFTGHRFHEKEEFVADYLIGENEKIEVKELSRFGVEPFEISVVRVTPSVAALPSVVNKTASLEVASIEPNYSTLPSYKIKFLNNSSKAVSAFAFRTLSGDRPGISSMPHKLGGEPLINPGDTYERTLPSTFRPEKTADEKIAITNQNETFIIAAVIFEDGTYEGEIKEAALFLAFTFGRKSQLKQIVPLLQKASESDFKNGELSRQISNLSIAADEITSNEFLKRFPPLTDREKSGFRGAVEGASQHVKKIVLEDLRVFEANQKKFEAGATQDRLKATKEKYQNWLARLSNQ